MDHAEVDASESPSALHKGSWIHSPVKPLTVTFWVAVYILTLADFPASAFLWQWLVCLSMASSCLEYLLVFEYWLFLQAHAGLNPKAHVQSIKNMKT